MKNHGRLYSGFVIMTIGILLLLGNLGIISWSILSGLSQIWPLIIVAVGLNMFFNNHILVKMFTFTALIVALVAAGMIYPPSDDWDFNFRFDGFNHDSAALRSITKEYQMEPNISSGELNLKLSAGSLNISGLEDNLLRGQFPSSYDTENAVTTDGGTRKIFNFDGGPFTLSGGANSNRNWEYRYELNNSIPWDVRIDAGATEANLDFRDIILRNLELNSGAGDIDIKIGKVERKAIIVADVKASDFKVTIPKEMGYKAVIEGALHDVSIDDDAYVKNGNVYTSENYSTAAQKVDLNLDVAVGDIQIELE